MTDEMEKKPTRYSGDFSRRQLVRMIVGLRRVLLHARAEVPDNLEGLHEDIDEVLDKTSFDVDPSDEWD